MKNKIFDGIAVLVIAIVAAWNVNFNSLKNDISDVSLANVEALADAEIISPNELGCKTVSCCLDLGGGRFTASVQKDCYIINYYSYTACIPSSCGVVFYNCN